MSKLNRLIDKGKLIHIYKQFKNNPLKIFIASDFSKVDRHTIRIRYINTLIILGVIKRVPTMYRCGVKYKAIRMVKGYKLKWI